MQRIGRQSDDTPAGGLAYSPKVEPIASNFVFDLKCLINAVTGGVEASTHVSPSDENPIPLGMRDFPLLREFSK
jgi:hypothetical protein